ncbi:SpoIIIAH-like family protein [Neobacillus fumarioli]|uniref:SpoIIIAH-like family protein n=1 Tax=Neobacillus fumarioli TaxID=105229 RepID=UPI0008318DF3|nr:SpoIIIAH-like family protein [Neobacillus fumarioli]
MLLKKQTVWLLTMLSLVVVLSVYYITSPEPKSKDLAVVEQNAKNQGKQQTKTQTNSKDSGQIISQAAGDSDFEALRMKLQDERSKQQEELTNELAATNLPADERSKIKDQMDKLNEIAQHEEVLETLIKTMGYDDALVRADGGQVKVTVKSKKKLSASEANNIIQKVKKEMNDTNFVAVEYTPSK